MLKLTFAVALCLAGAGLSQPGWAQATPDASAFQRGPWAELGTLEGGAILSISQARYREGAVLTFALKTEFAEGGVTLHTHYKMEGSWHLYRHGERWQGPDFQVRALLENADFVKSGTCAIGVQGWRPARKQISHL